MPTNEPVLREYAGTVTMVRTYVVLACSDFEAEEQVQDHLNDDVPEDSGWVVTGVSFHRKNIQLS